MAEEHSEESPFAMLWYVLGILGILILFWLMTHNPKTANVGALFLQSPLGTSSEQYVPSVSWLTEGTNAGTARTVNADYYLPSSLTAPQLTKYPRSPLYGSVTIEDYSGAYASDPQKEYVILYANSTNSGPVAISGWRLTSPVTGQSAEIGGGVDAPRLGSVMTTGVIELLPGQSAIITTGRSPIGVSFRENECSGYLGQFQQFTPALSLACPYPGADISVASNPTLAQESACVAAVASYAPCQTLTTTPSGVSAECSTFMSQRLTYDGCVAAHQSDSNFESSQWRLYLGRQQELWNNTSDVIALLDSEGRLVSGISY